MVIGNKMHPIHLLTCTQKIYDTATVSLRDGNALFKESLPLLLTGTLKSLAIVFKLCYKF